MEEIQTFLDRTSINEDRRGEIPLMVVLGTGNCSVNIVKILLQYGADVNFKDILGRSSLYYALKCRSEETIIRALLEAPGFSSINEVDRNGFSPLLFAIKKKCSSDIVKILLQHGSNVNFKDRFGRFPLFYALSCKRDEALITALLEARDFSSINEGDESDQTPLLCAIVNNYPSNIVKLLLSHGADINVKDTHGRSPLNYALECRNDDESLIRALLEAPGLSINEVDQNGFSPLVFAIKAKCSSNIIKMLLHYGSNVNFKDGFGLFPLGYAFRHKSDEALITALLEAPGFSSINEVDESYQTPLVCAIVNNYSSNIVIKMINSGANVNLQSNGRTPLIWALSNDSDEAIIRALLEAPGFNSMNQMDKCLSKTPLLGAIVRGASFNILKMLLQFGAYVGYLDSGIPILSVALSCSKDKATIKLLLKYSCLRIENFNALPLLQDYADCGETISYAVQCTLEMLLMTALEVSHGRTLRDVVNEDFSTRACVTLDDRELKTILDMLLKMRADIMCPVYLDMILVKVGKQEMITKLQEVCKSHSVNKLNSVSNLGKVLFIYGCACEVVQHLEEGELFKLILAFSRIPPSHYFH